MMTQAVLILAAWLSAADDKDLAKVQGTWQRTSMVIDGKEAPAELAAKQKLTIKGNDYALKIGEMTRKGTFALDSTRSPGHIDIKSASGPNKGKILKGIYEIDGDTLKYCVALPGKDRPTAFSSKSGSGHMLYVNKRVK